MMETIKILVVDDEPRMRKLVKDFLGAKGYEVLEAADGEEAVERFMGDREIALLILDVMMPKMDGWEVVKAVRQYSRVPIIMLTARGEERDELLGFKLGVDEYISKPFSPKILVARVEALLRRSLPGAGQQEIRLPSAHLSVRTLPKGQPAPPGRGSAFFSQVSSLASLAASVITQSSPIV